MEEEQEVRTICNRLGDPVHRVAEEMDQLAYGECETCKEKIFWSIQSTHEPSVKICRVCITQEPGFDPTQASLTKATAFLLKKLGYDADDLRRIGLKKAAKQFEEFTRN